MIDVEKQLDHKQYVAEKDLLKDYRKKICFFPLLN